MAQQRFIDPIVSVSPALTGTGNGTLEIDRLTHFTTAQTYTLTCIAKSPDTIFSIVGSLDGPVGLATVGSQFFDQDLKIFLTITQGSTAFEVGDFFTVTVENGTDLNQDNLDDYDEEPQKNFGAGTKGSMSGDHNIRFQSADQAARLIIQDLKYTAATGGSAGNSLQVQYLGPVAAGAASLVKEDLTFTAAPGDAGNDITVEFLDTTPATFAELTIQDLTWYAQTAGAAGNSYTVQYVNAGALSVGIVGTAITVNLVSGVTTAFDISAAVVAIPALAAQVIAAVTGTGANPQTAPVAATALAGGVDAIGEAGDEVVSVVGNAITVRMQNGASTATQIKTKLDASAPASALITTTITGTAGDAQAIFSAESLAGGFDAYGQEGAELANVSGNIIRVYMEAGKSTATQIRTAVMAEPSVTTLVSATVIGDGAAPQFGPVAATNLTGGKNKVFTLNHDELTDAAGFNEGNADLLAQDLDAQGNLSVDGTAELRGQVTLNDSSSANKSGPAIGNAQRFMNALAGDRGLTFRTSDDSKVVWTKPTLTFTGDIKIEMPGTGIVNTILSTESPVTIADGEHLYVILDRETSANVSPLVAANVPELLNAVRIASRYGDSLILADNTLMRDGSSVRIGEGGSGGGARADLHNATLDTLPSGASATIDGVSVTNGMLVLFTNLLVGPNRVYKASGVGTSIVWTAQSAWSTGQDPVAGDEISIGYGDKFAGARGVFYGYTVEFNNRIRAFTQDKYWEMGSLQTFTMLEGTQDEVFSVPVVGNENMIIDYSIKRGTMKSIGTIRCTTNGTDIAFDDSGSSYAPTIAASMEMKLDGSNLVMEYATSPGGGDAELKYSIKKWAD